MTFPSSAFSARLSASCCTLASGAPRVSRASPRGLGVAAGSAGARRGTGVACSEAATVMRVERRPRTRRPPSAAQRPRGARGAASDSCVGVSEAHARAQARHGRRDWRHTSEHLAHGHGGRLESAPRARRAGLGTPWFRRAHLGNARAPRAAALHSCLACSVQRSAHTTSRRGTENEATRGHQTVRASGLPAQATGSPCGRGVSGAHSRRPVLLRRVPRASGGSRREPQAVVEGPPGQTWIKSLKRSSSRMRRHFCAPRGLI